MKIVLKIIWGILVTLAFLLAFYYILNGGLTDLTNLFKENGVWGGIKQFFINLWEGFKASFAK